MCKNGQIIVRLKNLEENFRKHLVAWETLMVVLSRLIVLSFIINPFSYFFYEPKDNVGAEQKAYVSKL